MNEQLIEKAVDSLADLDISLHDAYNPKQEAREIAIAILTALGADEERHSVRINHSGGWTIEHPVHERLLGSLMNCSTHLAVNSLGWHKAGDYWVELVGPGDAVKLTKKEN